MFKIGLGWQLFWAYWIFFSTNMFCYQGIFFFLDSMFSVMTYC